MAEPVVPAGPPDAALPASIELAWGLRDRPAKGPKRALTLERIVNAGIAVATAEGLGAVSMARVAGEVGSSTMALYRYLPSKDDLLELMVDTGLGRPPAVFKNVRWRRGLRLWAEGIRDAYRANPWALNVPISSPPLGPNNLQWLEAALSCLRSTALTEQQKVSVVLLVSGFVRNEETLTMNIVAKMLANGDPPRTTAGRLPGSSTKRSSRRCAPPWSLGRWRTRTPPTRAWTPSSSSGSSASWTASRSSSTNSARPGRAPLLPLRDHAKMGGFPQPKASFSA